MSRWWSAAVAVSASGALVTGWGSELYGWEIPDAVFPLFQIALCISAAPFVIMKARGGSSSTL